MEAFPFGDFSLLAEIPGKPGLGDFTLRASTLHRAVQVFRVFC
jgi:hypothetical protein